ncbi:fluoride efflux transporter CrcB [Nemorincola caseinilytica]|uniref:Fluoride-specific ion channel FluC n=1 Tax=Nemorincola caseinilytica TaxID=2054315 RepID=A0ABP8NJD4_9BACT
MKPLLYVGLGGAAGSICRYLAGHLLARVIATPFPVATFSINVVGSLVIGVLFGMAGRSTWPSAEGGMLLLATGFCGGFTTFSAFALENVNLLQSGKWMVAMLYAVSSVVVGLLACRLGMMLAAR